MSDIYRDSIFWVEVERIKPNPYQPRREFDQSKLEELAESIRMYGLLQPLTVTRNEIPQADGGIRVEYELIAGERRLRASKIAKLTQVPVIIRTGEETDQVKLELAIIENLQREDLNPIDRALAFKKLAEEFEFTHAQIGKKVGRSREYVTNTLRLLTLPQEIMNLLAQGKISEGHTRPLLMLNDRPEEQKVLVKEVVLKKLSVRETEALARRAAQDKVAPQHKIDPEVIELERTLTEKLGTRVTIEQKEVGGRMVISFFSADDLSALLERLRLEEQAPRGVFQAPANEEDVFVAEKSVNEGVDTVRDEAEVFIQDVQERITSFENQNQSGVMDISKPEVVDVQEYGAVPGNASQQYSAPSSDMSPPQSTPRETQQEGCGASDTTQSDTPNKNDAYYMNAERQRRGEGVIPSPSRPVPSTQSAQDAPANTQSKNTEQYEEEREGVRHDTQRAPFEQSTLSTFGEVVAHTVPQPVSNDAAQKDAPPSNNDADDDLYSVRNFSI